MKKILCPIDFSEVSLNALEFAVAIAEKEHSSITLLNIFTPQDFDKILEKEHIKEEYKKLQEIAESKLKAISEEIMLISRNNLSVCKYLIKSGKIVDVLADLAEEEKYDLIVMGTTGHSAYERKYLGGQAEKIIHATHCSVMCIPENQSFHGIEHIVYATDYQEEDKLAIQQIAELSSVLDARVTILHVSHHNDTIDKAIYEQFKEELSHFVGHNKKIDFKRVIFDHVSEGLDNYMKQMQSDLLVLLNKKQNFLKILFHKSLIDHLDKFTEYPLMIIKL
jgi:nucleotide-binding universal stress UspA family protein